MSVQARHDRAMEIFDQVCDLPTGQQAGAIANLCGDDDSMRRDVEALLRHDAKPMQLLRGECGGAGVEILAAGLAVEARDQSQHHDQLPARIGQYRIIRQIGAGGMGVVYLAMQSNPQREVALKVIRSTLATSDSLRRFEHEAHILGLLAHPGIAQIFEAGTAPPMSEDGAPIGPPQPFFAMEYIDGSPLKKFADEHQLDTTARLELLMQVCRAVEYAHQRGVIHRDLKPGNILVVVSEQMSGDRSQTPGTDHAARSSDSRAPTADAFSPKILDFGVARLAEAPIAGETLHTSVGQLVGTLQYMSPEQIAADPATIDTRSDVYALGVIMHELLAGTPPYDVGRLSMHEAARIIREESPVRLGAVNRAFRGDLETITLKALEKDKDRRYQSAADLAEDLRRLLHHEPIIARPASAAYRVRKFAQRHKVAATLATATALALVAGTVVSVAFGLHARRVARDEAHQRRVAEDTSSLLFEVLSLPDPHSGGQNMTVLDMVDALVQRLNTDAGVLPEVEASVRATAANTYMGLGRPARAEEESRRTVALHRTLPGHETELARSLNRLGLACQLNGNQGDAEAAFREVLDLIRDRTGMREFEEITRINLATTLIQLGRREEAEPYFVEAHRLMAMRVEDPVSIVGSLRHLGRLHHSMGRLETAESELRQALAMTETAIAPNHPTIGATLLELGKVLRAMGREADACPELERAWRETSASRTVGAFDWVIVHKELWSCYIALDRRDDAERLAVDGLKAVEAKLGANHAVTSELRNRLAAQYELWGRPDDAARLRAEPIAATPDP